MSGRTTQRGKENKAKILLADDNFDMREYVARLLSAKYEVISVSNGPHPLLPHYFVEGRRSSHGMLSAEQVWRR